MDGCVWVFFFQGEGGLRGLVRSRGLGDGYKGKVKIIDARGLFCNRGKHFLVNMNGALTLTLINCCHVATE